MYRARLVVLALTVAMLAVPTLARGTGSEPVFTPPLIELPSLDDALGNADTNPPPDPPAQLALEPINLTEAIESGVVELSSGGAAYLTNVTPDTVLQRLNAEGIILDADTLTQLRQIALGERAGIAVDALCNLTLNNLSLNQDPEEVGYCEASASPPGAGANGIGVSLPPAFGTVTLSNGFTPDPLVISLTPGGDIDVAQALGEGCFGYVASAPDFELVYIAGQFPLTFWVDAASDTTLVINAPDGTFYCDDDSAGNLSPQVQFASPSSGTYDVWVGTYSMRASGFAELNVSEQGGPGSGGGVVAGGGSQSPPSVLIRPGMFDASGSAEGFYSQLATSFVSVLGDDLPTVPAAGTTVYQTNAAATLTEDAETDGLYRVFRGAFIDDVNDIYRDAVMLAQRVDGAYSVCSGILLTPTLVVSAAHCVCLRGIENPIVLIGTDLIGAARHETDGLPATMVDCADRTSASAASLFRAGDVALFRLTEPIEGLAFRRIAPPEMINNTRMVRAVGWGARRTPSQETVPAADLEPKKFLGDITISSYDCIDLPTEAERPGGCQAGYEMVAVGGADTCEGDSGGPVYVLAQFELALFVAGITSRGYNPKAGCGGGGIYVRLSAEPVRTWLIENGVPESVFETSVL